MKAPFYLAKHASRKLHTELQIGNWIHLWYHQRFQDAKIIVKQPETSCQKNPQNPVANLLKLPDVNYKQDPQVIPTTNHTSPQHNSRDQTSYTASNYHAVRIPTYVYTTTAPMLKIPDATKKHNRGSPSTICPRLLDQESTLKSNTPQQSAGTAN